MNEIFVFIINNQRINKQIEKNYRNLMKRIQIRPDKKYTKFFKNKTILITGGAGSLGSALTKELIQYPVKSIRILDINEHALFQLNRTLKDPRLRLLLGSVLDKDRVEMAGNNADIIIHTAAVKNIEISEFNPIETVDINVTGIINMIKMAIRNKPEIFLNISTDKAAESTTLYGTTKQLSEKLISWAGHHIKYTKFATARFGNIIESRGNVFEIWNDETSQKKPLSITDPAMERYFFHINDAVNFVLRCTTLTSSGEIFVPKMKSYNILDMAKKISKNYKIIGIRQGEKINEVLLTSAEKKMAKEEKDLWIIKPYSPYL